MSASLTRKRLSFKKKSLKQENSNNKRISKRYQSIVPKVHNLDIKNSNLSKLYSKRNKLLDKIDQTKQRLVFNRSEVVLHEHFLLKREDILILCSINDYLLENSNFP